VRVVSLLPSATEIVCFLDLQDRLVGVTESCDYPPSVRSLPRIVRSRFDPNGLTSSAIDATVRSFLEEGESSYEVDAAGLLALAPDLVLTQDLCPVCAVSSGDLSSAVTGMNPQPRVVVLHPKTLEDVFQDILRVGEALGAASRAQEAVLGLRERLRAIRVRAKRPRVAALEWLDPLMSSGHWVADQIHAAGGEDVLGRSGEPSRRVSWEEICAAAPDILFLMPCGFDAERAASEAAPLFCRSQSIPALREGRVYAVNGGAYFSRPGPRIVDGAELLAELLDGSSGRRLDYRVVGD
jgi:iron complex transport system substrate-binding protein